MKCISCGNLIPDTSTTCPYCNNKVEPAVSAIPIYDVPAEKAETVIQNNEEVVSTQVQTEPGVPVTPVAPILPQDQELTMQPVEPVMQVAEETPVVGVQPTSEMAQPVEVSTPVENNGWASVSTEVPQPNLIDATPVPPMENPMLDGVKIASSAPVEKKKKSKLPLILIIVILISALVGGGVFFYTSQYKSVNTRIDSIVNGLFSFTSSIKNETVNLASGTYKINANASSEGTEMSAKLNGKYAYDLENKLINVTLTAEEINMGDELKLIPEGNALNLELYTYDSKAYILLKNFYENYIYSDIEGYDELFKSIKETDINYQLIINSYKNAIKSALKAANYTQTIDDVAVNGKSQKANVIKLVLNSDNQKKIVTTLYKSLINNTKLLEEMAKISDQTAEELKEELQDSLDEMEFESDNAPVVEIYTAMFGEKFIGAKMTGKTDEDKDALMEFLPITNGMKLVMKEAGKEIVNLEFSSVTKKTSTQTEVNVKVSMRVYVEEQETKVSVDVTTTSDNTPKAEKVNIKNSVDYRYISTEDQQKIITSISNYGTLGTLFQTYVIGSLIPNPEPEVPTTDTTVNDQVTDSTTQVQTPAVNY